MPIRWNLKPHLKRMGWTPYRLAKEAGLEPSTVYKIQKAKRVGYVDVATLTKIAKALDVEDDPFSLLEHRP